MKGQRLVEDDVAAGDEHTPLAPVLNDLFTLVRDERAHDHVGQRRHPGRIDAPPGVFRLAKGARLRFQNHRSRRH